MTQPDLAISFTVTKPDGEIETHEFSSNESIKIGSGKSAQLQLKGENVSSLHCMVKPVEDGVRLLDLGSDEGIELNGEAVEDETNLEDGDSILIGGYRLTVHMGGEATAPTVPIRSSAEGARDSLETTVREPSPVSDDEEPKLSEDPVREQHDEKTELVSRSESQDEEPRKTVSKKKKKAKEKGVKASSPSDTKEDTLPGKKSKKSKKPKKSKKSQKADKIESNTGGETKEAAKKQKKDAQPAVEKGAERKTEKKSKSDETDHGGRKSLVKTEALDPILTEKDRPTEKKLVDVTMIWGGSVIGVQRISEGSITIGNNSAADFRVSHKSLSTSEFTLVTMSALGAVVKVAAGMELLINGKESSSTEVNLDVGQEIVIRLGAVEFLVQYAKRYQAIKVGFFQTLDYFYSKVFGLALILQIGLIIAFLITPTFGEDDEEDLMAHLNEFQALILQQPEKKKEKKLSGKKAAKRKDDEGLFGKKDKPKEDKLASKGAPKIDKDKREEDKKAAMDALAALGLTDAPKGMGLGTGINQALGGLRGASMGDAGGAGGLGSRGTGAGGGGNSLGIGGLGSGTGRGSGGRGGIDLGGRGKGMTRIKPGKVIFKGSLSREEIQRVIRRVMSQIKFCYERELAKDPNLQGKLVATWTIQGTGLVSKSRMAQNTMGNKQVEACVLRIINRLRFPKPKGGGNVFVTYPFVFSSSG